MLRGEIRLVDFDPVTGVSGSQHDQRRAAVIVSNDSANSAAARLGQGVVTVVPLTSNLERVHPFQVLLKAGETGLSRDSKAQAEEVRSVAVDRLGARVGVVPPSVLRRLDDALRLHLSL
ncbi:MAG TPA: type II toxin-antitoxin system PemK/MazF family toxin [Acidimicrobiales bacterium]|nr:type II toxin-antitoxin system PemK/MazF family toxin [Acidimicrobiales bacterium]